MLYGRYHGTILLPRWLRIARFIWRGKVFAGDTVVNLIGPFQLIRGKVDELSPGFYTITYRGGLTDMLQVLPNKEILGTLDLGFTLVRFQLRKEN